MLFRYLFRTIVSTHMNLRENWMVSCCCLYMAIPFFLLLGQMVSLALFFLGEMDLFAGWWVLLFIGVYCSFGNFAPFYQIGTALVLDGIKGEVLLLPLLMFNFYFYMWNISRGFLDAVADIITKRKVHWAKTKRFTDSAASAARGNKKEEKRLEKEGL